MPGFFKLFGFSAMLVASSAMVMDADAVSAARGRARAGGGTTTARMPSMPTQQINNAFDMGPNNDFTWGVPDVPNTPNTPQPDTPVPDNPQPDVPGPTPDVPAGLCPDGGVRDSVYTVAMCMDDVHKCIISGGVANGMNDMFNEDLRNAIVNGMGVCAVQVDKCVATVRKNCSNVYRSAEDVWIDFNARKVQPEYYNFVLRKTGLTPNQAENTCLLLDRNTYGNSFAAVDNSGKVTAEYNKKVGAYNSQNGGSLSKKSPQGVKPNIGNSGVDGQRGHYARWDATNATCLVRVAAYNKDKHITNSWLFGAVGDDKPAEVWKATGETFSCNKDLFGFSLMTNTKTVATVGVAGGTLVGAGVGAIAGHGKRDFDCTNEKHRKMLTEALIDNRTVGIVNEYILSDIATNEKVMGESSCDDVMGLFDKYYQFETAAAECAGAKLQENSYFESMLVCTNYTMKDDCYAAVARTEPAFSHCIGKGLVEQQCVELLYTLYENGQLQVDETDLSGECVLRSMNLAKQERNGAVYNQWINGDYVLATDITRELERLDNVFTDSVVDLLVNGEKSNMGKSIAIGAATGAAVGGLSTAITAFVERNNISCHVGDGLEVVGFNKSHSIGSLKDFYVKWNLRLPDTIAPTAMITDCQSWKDTCATFTDLNDCKRAQFNYKPADAKTTTLIRAVCAPSGSICVENYPVAKSYGACE